MVRHQTQEATVPGSAHASLLVQHELSDHGFEFKLFENELFISST